MRKNVRTSGKTFYYDSGFRCSRTAGVLIAVARRRATHVATDTFVVNKQLLYAMIRQLFATFARFRETSETRK